MLNAQNNFGRKLTYLDEQKAALCFDFLSVTNHRCKAITKTMQEKSQP